MHLLPRSHKKSGKAGSGLPQRKVPLLERYTLVNTNVGEPYVLVFLACYPDASKLPTWEYMEERIKYLQAKWPMLWATVKGTDGETPFYEARSEGFWPTEDVLFSHKYPRHDKTINAFALEWIEKEALDMVAYQRGLTEGAGRSPWRVTLLSPEPESGESDGKQAAAEQPLQAVPSNRAAYLSLSCNHAFFDGIGALRFMRCLLAAADSPMLLSLSTEILAAIPAMEETINVKPRLLYMLPIVWRELVVPLFPKRLQDFIAPADTWPGLDVRKPLFSRPTRFTAGCVDAQVMESLKRWSKVKGGRTLYPVLHVAYVTAMWNVLHVERRARDRESQSVGKVQAPQAMDHKSFKLQISLPKAERYAALGHPFCSGFYLSDFEVDFVVDEGKKSKKNQDFWARVRGVSDLITNKKAQQDARGTVGVLRYIPKGVYKLDPAQVEKGGPKVATTWEEVFYSRSESSQPYRLGAALSNLGYVDDLPPEVGEFWWSQTVTFLTPAVILSMFGHRGGLRWTSSFKDGGCAVTKEEMERLERLVEQILVFVANADWNVREDIGLESLVKECS